MFTCNNNNNNNNNTGNNELNDQFLTMVQSVKEYFKELNSVYELCRLGIHRPALRLAPDQGFIRVPLSKFKANKLISRTGSGETAQARPTFSSSSPTKKLNKAPPSTPTLKKEPHETTATNQTEASKTTSVDEWFTKIQTHKSTRQLGHNLKSYAKIFKALGAKIATGHSSTMTTTIQSNIFAQEAAKASDKKSAASDSKASPQAPTPVKPPVTQSFQSTIVPTVSAINLDRSLFEEVKPSKHIDTPQGVIQPNPQPPAPHSSANTTSSLSSLLNQPINQTDIINLSQTDFSINHNAGATSGVSGAQSTGQAQILTNFSSSSGHQTGGEQTSLANANSNAAASAANSEKAANSSNNSVLAQQQQTLNNLASGSNLTQIAQLTANLIHPPTLVVYIIDPFDYYLYNRVRLYKSKANGGGATGGGGGSQHGPRTAGAKANMASGSANGRSSASKLNLKKKVTILALHSFLIALHRFYSIIQSRVK